MYFVTSKKGEAMKKQLLILSLAACVGFQVNATIFDKVKEGLDAGKTVTEIAKEFPAVIAKAKGLADKVIATQNQIKYIIAKKAITPDEAKKLVQAVVNTGNEIEQMLQSLLTILNKLGTNLVGKFDAPKGKTMVEGITRIKQAVDALKALDNTIQTKVIPMLDKIPSK